jgi:hypothetical protein
LFFRIPHPCLANPLPLRAFHDFSGCYHMNLTTVYQGAILEDEKNAPSTPFTTATQVRSTSTSRPFTSEFVQAQLILATDKSRTLVQVLYDERLPDDTSNGGKKRNEKGDDGSEEAAKSPWRLSSEEARCVLLHCRALLSWSLSFLFGMALTSPKQKLPGLPRPGCLL